MILGIDASNISATGGLTHLVEVLAAADPPAHGFSRVIVWSGGRTLDRLADRPWLQRRHVAELDGGLLARSWWQRSRLSAEARNARCSVLFVPGGSYSGTFSPMATFHQNLLPFQWREVARFGWSPMVLKMALLRATQGRTFRRAGGVIFLTRYARDVVFSVLGDLRGWTAVIPHGVDPVFRAPVRPQRPMSAYSDAHPFRLLYVSSVFPYKHHGAVAEATMHLRGGGAPVALDLIGPASEAEARQLRNVLARLDPSGTVLRYLGPVPHAELPAQYAAADLFVFASSCETFGQILTEAMSSGLPIACAGRSAMPELLGDAGEYFDPEDPADIARAVRTLLDAPDLRASRAHQAQALALQYSWSRCANDTLAFLAAVGRDVPSHPDPT